MTRSARDLVNSNLPDGQANPDARPATPEPTTESGVERQHALYDTPPHGGQPAEYVEGPRRRQPTSRGKKYREEFERDETKRLRGNDTRARNAALHTQTQVPEAPSGNDLPRNSSDHNAQGPSHSQPPAGPLPKARRRKRKSKGARRSISRSPTPGSTDREPEGPAQPQTSNSWRTYETLDREGLIKYAKEKFNLDVRGRDTQSIFAMLRDAEARQAPQVGPARQPASIVIPSGTPLNIGSGWQYDLQRSEPPAQSGSSGKKRGSDASMPDGSTKRQRTAIQENEDTEGESDRSLERRVGPVWVAAERIARACPGASIDPRQPPRLGTRPPPPSREPTPPTVPTTPTLDASHSIGASLSQYGTSVPPLPMLLSPPRGPVHARLRGRLLQRFLDATNRDAEAAQAEQDAREKEIEAAIREEEAARAEEATREAEIEAAIQEEKARAEEAAQEEEAALVRLELDSDEIDELDYTDIEDAREPEFGAPNTDEVDELDETDLDEAQEPQFGTTNTSQHQSAQGPSERNIHPSVPDTVTQRTYLGARSLAPSAPEANATAPVEEDDDDPWSSAIRPNSPSLTTAQLIRRERVRAMEAKAHAEMENLFNGHRRSRLFTEATQPPTTRPQARPPPPTTNTGVSGAHTQGNRRLDPVAAAHADMVAFNRAAAQNDATSFVQSVARQSRHTARRAPPASRPAHELLEDDEDMLAKAEAFVNSQLPKIPPPSRGRNRKPKPLARDVSGIERQVLIMAKIHLFAYALSEGVYQTRATFLRWAAAVHRATWGMELPGVQYQPPTQDILEILVNNIATVRGKTRDRARPFTATAAGFQQSLMNEQVIQENLRRFHLIYPNSFHCKTYCPRRGHYENPEVAHCIATTLFHGPNSVGVMYPDYFADMPLTVVAFVLAIWQFCIEEWSNGWHQNGDLSMGAMREKYEAQLAGLKELCDVAPRRMKRLQEEWRDYVAEYSGAQFTSPEDVEAEGSRPSEMRPDTPEPEQDLDAMSVEEMIAQLLETARQESLRERLREIIAREEEDLTRPGTPMDVDDPYAGTPRSARSQSPAPPPAEYNEQGRLTARSKGKRRAN